jgi:hypothetical protein
MNIAISHMISHVRLESASATLHVPSNVVTVKVTAAGLKSEDGDGLAGES